MSVLEEKKTHARKCNMTNVSRKTFNLDNIVVTLYGSIGGGTTAAVYNNPGRRRYLYIGIYIIIYAYVRIMFIM